MPQSLQVGERTNQRGRLYRTVKVNPCTLGHRRDHNLTPHTEFVCDVKRTGACMGRPVLKWKRFIENRAAMRTERHGG